jgi:LuxR family maltose regulon positive regulatory protein
MTRNDLILQTKLEPPRVKGKTLRRERLLDLLKDNMDKKLILLCADAGYGKTTLLAQFCDDLSIPFVYYDLDDTDNNMATFFSYIVTGFRKYDARFGKAVEDLVSQTEYGNIDIVVGTFINQFIKKIHSDFYIILDDFHYLQKNNKICGAIDYLLRHLPKHLHLVISSRAVPNINLAYHLAQQELFKIEKEHLRFTGEEIQLLLNTVYALDVSSDEIKRIAAFSEGWITLLQLILQRIRGDGAEITRDALDSCAASDENIFDYFAREVFEQTPKPIREFLLKTSVLEYLNPKVCDYLLHIRRSKKIIAFLESENMFISKVGDNFQYHPVFHEFLREMVGQYFTSGVVKKLHHKAGMYLFTLGDYTSAIKHLVAAERYAKAAQILEKQHQYWMRRADYSTLVSLVDCFPNEILEEHPHLLLRKADALDNLDRKTQALRLTESALKSFRLKKNSSGTAQALMLKALIYFNQGQRRKGLYYANKAYHLIAKKDSQMKARILMQIGSMYRDACRFEKAKASFESALKILQRFEDRELEESLLTRIALLHFTMSNFKEADRLFMNVLSRFSDLLYGLDLVYKYSTVVAINCDLGDYEKAWEYLDLAEEGLQKYNDPWIAKYLVYIRGHLHWAQGNFRKALEDLQEAVEKYETYSKILDPYIFCDIIDSYLRLGETAKAREAFSKMDSLLDIINETPNLRANYLTIKGALESAEGTFKDALVSLKEALRKARSIDKYYLSMITYGELSKCYLRHGVSDQALRYFKKCLDIARIKEYDAHLLIEARDNIDLFKLALENGYRVEYILRLLDRVDTEQAKDVINWMQLRRGMYDLECRLFGELEIRDAKGDVIRPDWRTKNTEELFVLFITRDKRKFSKDELIDTFWPHKNLQGAAHSLHVEISALRHTLRAMLRSEFDRQRIVVFDSGQYFINRKILIRTDVQKFQQLVNQAAAAFVHSRAKAKRLYLQAIDLYRGDFCSNIAAQWCEDFRAYFKKQTLEGYKKLAQICQDEKDYRQSIEYLNRALCLDASDESVHIGVMRCLEALGDKDGIQRQYKKLIKTLKQMGISIPSPEATAIYQKSLR